MGSVPIRYHAIVSEGGADSQRLRLAHLPMLSAADMSLGRFCLAEIGEFMGLRMAKQGSAGHDDFSDQSGAAANLIAIIITFHSLFVQLDGRVRICMQARRTTCSTRVAA